MADVKRRATPSGFRAMTRRAGNTARQAGSPIALCAVVVPSLFSRGLARNLAANPRLPRVLLWLLPFHCWDVRATIASHPRCPRLLLKALQLAQEWAIQAAIAANPAAGERLLELIIATEPSRVRLYAATNPALSGALADRLLADPDPCVRAVAATHPAASAQALTRLAATMTEPPWILQRIAVHPSCPQELSDQVLTWLALGGAGDGDPMFDPVECTAHPGDAKISAAAWYAQAAAAVPDGSTLADNHPLWRVRAAVLRAGTTINSDRARALARDPRPEVRLTLASAARLGWRTRRELRLDADPSVGRAAAILLKRKGASPGRWRMLIRVPRWLFLAGILVNLAIVVFRPAPAPAPAPAGAGSGQQAMVIRSLPGGGSIQCGGQKFAAQSYVLIRAGSEEMTVQFPDGEVTTVGGRLLVPAQAVVPAGQSQEYLFTDGPSPVTVLAMPPGGEPVPALTLAACG